MLRSNSGIVGQWLPDPEEGRRPQQLMAVVMVDRVHPHVIAYDDDEDGMAELTDRIAEGTVLAVIRGRQLDILTDSKVVLTDGVLARSHSVIGRV